MGKWVPRAARLPVLDPDREDTGGQAASGTLQANRPVSSAFPFGWSHLVYAIILWGSLGAALPCAAAEDGSSPALLARSVPADARLYLEFHTLNSFVGTPLDLVLSRLVGGLLPSKENAASGPTGTQPGEQAIGWRAWFARTMGLADPRAADLLFSGPIAFAAEGWSGLGDAVLLAEPKDAAAFETAMKRHWVAGSDRVRRYRLTQEHELACDGKVVVVGRSGESVNLYQKTAALWENEGGGTLSGMKEFSERMADLPAGAQVIFYAGTSARTAGTGLFLGQWWPADWARLRSVALGARISLAGLMVDLSGRLEPEAGPARPRELAVEALQRLPASVVVAWTQPVDFVEWFRRFEADDPVGILQWLLADMPGRSIEWQLLGHLGRTVFVVAEAPMPSLSAGAASAPAVTTTAAPSTGSAPASRPPGSGPASAAATAPAATRPAVSRVSTRPAGPRDTLRLPVLAMLIETDDPHAVEAAVERLTTNMYHLVATRSPGDAATLVRRIPESGGGQIVSVPLGSLFASRTQCPFLTTLEVSWIIWDRWLIVGTSSDVVRQLVAARRGEGRLLAPALIPQFEKEIGRPGAAGEMLLVAQPQVLANVLNSWVAYIQAKHPEMLGMEWWRELGRRQRSTGVQLGVVPTARVLPGAVEVRYTLPDYPADGLLKTGDHILAVNGRSLATDTPMQSLREMLALAGESGKVTLKILRDGRTENVTIAMPRPQDATQVVHPITLIRQAVRFLRPFPTAGYAVWRPAPDQLKAHLELRFTISTQPAN